MRAPYSTVDNHDVRLRPATHEDLQAVFVLMAARDVADLGQPDIVLQDLADRWAAGEFALAENAVVAELGDGRLAAYAEANRHGGLIAIAPEHEGDEIASALLEWTERRERGLGHQQLRQLFAARNAHGSDLARRAGYQLVRHVWRMVRVLAEPDGLSAPRLPPRITIRAPEADGDAAALHAIDTASFLPLADFEPISLSAFTEEHLRAHDVDLGLSSVAEQAGELVGFLLTRRWQDEGAGFIDLLAVHPDHQHRGIGGALLLTAFSRIAAAGLREAQLTVASDNPRALALYEKVGMTVRFQHDIWERHAAPGGGASG
jgi:ribosomal protein S18 acetylase RimI-like enzyme